MSEVKVIKTEDIEMNCAVIGDGEKIFVMIPGISVKNVTPSAAAVEKQYRKLLSDYTIYLYDRRTNIKEGYTIKDMAIDTVKVMKSQGIEKADFFGASQGGQIVLYIAALYPEMVGKAVVTSTTAEIGDEAAEIIDQWISCAERKDRYSLAKGFVEKVYSEELQEKFKDILIGMGDSFTDEELEHFVILAKTLNKLDLCDYLDDIRCPMLVLGSKKDRVFTVENFRNLADKTGGELYIYDDFGHAVYDEAPDFADRLYGFLVG